jgi:hypothetical protein
MGESAIRALIDTQKKIYDEKLVAAKKAAEERKAAEREAALAAIRKPKEIVVPAAIADEQPTAAQKRRGATTRVHCSVCGVGLFRRKKEVESQSNFFCSSAHQNQWKQNQRIAPSL